MVEGMPIEETKECCQSNKLVPLPVPSELLPPSCARIDRACNVVPVTGARTFALLVALN